MTSFLFSYTRWFLSGALLGIAIGIAISGTYLSIRRIVLSEAEEQESFLDALRPHIRTMFVNADRVEILVVESNKPKLQYSATSIEDRSALQQAMGKVEAIVIAEEKYEIGVSTSYHGKIYYSNPERTVTFRLFAGGSESLAIDDYITYLEIILENSKLRNLVDRNAKPL